MAGDEGCGEIMRLPEDCISHIFSLTSPADCCRSAVVSTMFRSAAESDSVWECFLPSDYEEILSRADDPVEFSSKKELYCRLSDSILIDRGRMSFSLERFTGRKCYTLSARELEIVVRDTPQYWKWKPMNFWGLKIKGRMDGKLLSPRKSRFSEVAEVLNFWGLKIKGRMDGKLLSPRTNYAAYLIFKPTRESYGYCNQWSRVCVGGHSSITEVWRRTEGRRAPNTRIDGWMEMGLGEFFGGDGNDGNVDILFLDTYHAKEGLIVEGIEVRPK